VWRVYNRLCPQLDSVVANPPLNLKKQLVEKFPGQFKFGPAILEDYGGAVTVEVEVFSDGNVHNFRGRGSSIKLAEVAASKCALRWFERKAEQRKQLKQI